MPEDYGYDDDIDDEEIAEEQTPAPAENPNYARVPRKVIRNLERQAKEAETLRGKVTTAERKALFYEAGLNPADPKVKWFVKAYDGENTVEAVREAAEEAGYLDSGEPSVGESELAEQQAAANLAAGTTGGSSAAADEAYHQELAAANSPAEATQVMLKYGKPITTVTQ